MVAPLKPVPQTPLTIAENTHRTMKEIGVMVGKRLKRPPPVKTLVSTVALSMLL